MYCWTKRVSIIDLCCVFSGVIQDPMEESHWATRSMLTSWLAYKITPSLQHDIALAPTHISFLFPASEMRIFSGFFTPL